MRDRIGFQYAVYCLPLCKMDPLQAVKQAAHDVDPALSIVVELPKKNPSTPIVWAHVENDVARSYAPPDLHILQYFGRGITPDQARQVQESKQAVALIFAHPKAFVWQSLKAANGVAELVARKTGGLIWDGDSRLMYSPDEWHAQRVASWTCTPPEVAKYISIHLYKDGEYVRAVTVGMTEFGLPDIVVEQFSWADNRPISNLINVLAQVMAEGASVVAPGKFNLDLRTIRNDVAREKQTFKLMKGATSVARLKLLQGVPDEGDPNNRLIEIAFDNYPGEGLRAKQDALLSSLFGAEESIARVKHDDTDLKEVSAKAIQRLPELKQAFNTGLRPGEFIELKSPFDTPDGTSEYMWVEVTRWDDSGVIKGLLRNDPENVPDLHAGEIVTIQQSRVFDYLIEHSDGTQEGNETGQLLLKRQGASK